MLGREGDSAKIIAGGQSLVPMMAMRLSRPSLLVDINEIAGLKFIEAGKSEASVVRIGACTRQCVIERDTGLAAQVPMLRDALHWVGHVQTRSRGTLGGSLVHADPAAELPLAAQVLGAELVLRSAAGARSVVAHDFFAGPMMSAIEPNECLEEIRWPIWREQRVGSAFTEISIRHGDFAIVAAAAQIALDDAGRCARAAFGFAGVGQTALAFPRLAERLVGTRLDDEIVQSVVHDAAAELAPSADLHASAAYRTHLARVLGVRVLRTAHADADKAQPAGTANSADGPREVR